MSYNILTSHGYQGCQLLRFTAPPWLYESKKLIGYFSKTALLGSGLLLDIQSCLEQENVFQEIFTTGPPETVIPTPLC
jgi:hypothetical protein